MTKINLENKLGKKCERVKLNINRNIV